MIKFSIANIHTKSYIKSFNYTVNIIRLTEKYLAERALSTVNTRIQKKTWK